MDREREKGREKVKKCCGLVESGTACPPLLLWPRGIGARLRRNRLRVLVVPDTYPMFIEPTITRVPSGFSEFIWLDTKTVLKKDFNLPRLDGFYDIIHEFEQRNEMIHGMKFVIGRL